MDKINNRSPLRYPGGKTRACGKLGTILEEHFDIVKFNSIVSPFFGGGSFEFFIQNNYQLNIIANDRFVPLYNFWCCCKLDKKRLCEKLTKNINLIGRQEFVSLREKIMEEKNKLNQFKSYYCGVSIHNEVKCVLWENFLFTTWFFNFETVLLFSVRMMHQNLVFKSINAPSESN